MMISYNKELLERYLKNDWIKKMMDDNLTQEDREVRTNAWLYEMEGKRYIYADLYGDILKGDCNHQAKVLDVGGGVNVLTRVLATNCQYELLDFLAHGGQEWLKANRLEERMRWYEKDWYEFEVEKDYDIVIANDIFPDVDQRLELFIDKFIPHCKELRLVLTYYNKPRFYTTKRTDDSEILTFLSWDGEITGLKMKKYLERMNVTLEELDKMSSHSESMYWNGRQVAFVIISGDA